MVIGIDIRALMQAEYSGVPEYTHRLLREIFSQDKQNEYRLFFNSARNLAANIPDFSAPNVILVNTRYPNKIFNLVLQKNIGFPKIDRLLDCDLFFEPNINFISLSAHCRKIITVHDLSFLKHSEFYSLKGRLWHRFINVKKTLHMFDQIVAVSESTKRDLIDLCDIRADKIKVIYSGISGEYQPRDPADANLQAVKKKYDLPNKFIFHLGTLEPRKNLMGIIAAYDHLITHHPALKEYKLVIAGGSGWRNHEICQAMLSAKHAAGVRHIGFVDKNDKAALYNLASVFVYPSHYEGFGFPPLEALASGTPVVTSSVSSLPEVMGDSAVLVNPNNYREISEAILLILNNKSLKQALWPRGRAQAEKFTWQNTAQSYLTLFNN